jgi:Mg/Co/Ni transporter MgtE
VIRSLGHVSLLGRAAGQSRIKILRSIALEERTFMTPGHSSGQASPREIAASHMITQIPRASADTPVNTVIQSLCGQKFECADTVFVTDSEGRLEGIVRINDLFADGERRIGEIMEPEHEAVRYEDDQEQIAVLAMRLNMIAVPIVDDDERLIGVGFGLPWVFQRLGSDPALGSGPICTIIQDVASLFIYFVLVRALIM